MAEAWGIGEGLPTPQAGREALIEHLYPRMQARSHFDHLWDSLPEASHRLVTFLAIHGGDLGLRELARRSFGGDARAARRALVPLVECGLVFRDSETSAKVTDDVYGLPDLLLRHIELYAHYQGYLGQFLNGRSTEELEEIATRGLRLTLKSNRRDHMRHVLRRTLLRPSSLRAHVKALSPGERELIHTVLRRGGVCIYGDLIDLGYQRHADHTKVEMLNHLLRTSGLLFVAAKGENKYANLLQIPKDVAHVIRTGYIEDRRGLAQLDTATAGGRRQPSVAHDNGAQILRDLVIFTNHVQRQGVKRLASGGIGKNDLKRIQPMLSPGKSLKYARFLGLAAIEQRLIEAVGDRWQVAERCGTWFESPVRAFSDLVRVWANSPSWNEEYAEGDVLHTDAPIRNLINITEVRRLVVESLAQLPHGEWVEFRAFANVLLPKVALAVPRRPQAMSGKFNRPPFYIAESIIADSLHWLGVVAIGSDNRDHLEAVQGRGNLPLGGPRRRLRKRLTSVEDTHLLFRVTELGGAALEFLSGGSRGEMAQAEPLAFDGDTFTVQPNHEILSPPNLRLPTLRKLLAFCEVRSVDVMTGLAVTSDSVRQGLDQGLTGDEILAVLREGWAAPLPQTINHLVEEGARRSSDLQIGLGGGFLLVEDPVAMAEICANRRLKSMIREVVDDRVIIFHPHAPIKRVAQEIEKLGYAASVDGQAAVPNEAGRVSVALSERDLLLVIASLRFTADLERELGIDLSEGRLRSVAGKLEPGGPRFEALLRYAETLSRRFGRRHAQALRRRVEQATQHHRRQVAKLVDSAVARSRGRFHFRGANPATLHEDVRALLRHAIEHEMPVEVRHRTVDKKEVTEQLRPESVEGDHLYAFSGAREAYLLFRFDRILEAKLL
jgi:hypothetical protein